MALGGVIVGALWQAFGLGDYLGLSTPLVSQAFGPTPPPAWSFAAKLLLTAVTLGLLALSLAEKCTPRLMVIGACLGSAVAGVLGHARGPWPWAWALRRSSARRPTRPWP